MTEGYPRTIDDGGGSQLTFVRRTTDERGELLEVVNEVAPGHGPPMHVHHFQEEGLTVREGKLGWARADGSEGTAGPGGSVVFEPGEAHKFWNAGDEPLRCSGYIRPPDNVEYFLTQLYESSKRNGGTRPNPFDGAYLSRHFRSEFAMTEIPAAVQRFVFPVIVGLGRLLGKHRRFADAPQPRRA